MNNNELTTTCWIHYYYPYIPSVSIDSNSTNSDIISALNKASANPNLVLLDREIEIGKKLTDGISDKLNDTRKQLFDSIHPNIKIFLNSDLLGTNVSFKFGLNRLKTLQNTLKSPNEITMNQLHTFGSGETENWNGWVITTKDLEPNGDYKLFSGEDETKILCQFKKFGTVGKVYISYIDRYDDTNFDPDVTYGRKKTTNLVETTKAILSVIAPEEVLKYRSNADYENDSKLLRLQDYHKKKKYSLGNYGITLHYSEENDKDE